MSVSTQELDALETAHDAGFKDGYAKGYYDATTKVRDDAQKTLDRISKTNPLCAVPTVSSVRQNAFLASTLTKTK